MSDPVTNSEVENVLASIRRLVGDTSKAGKQAAQETADDKLVLTPQQRVAEPQALKLTRESEVVKAPDWDAFEEPPLTPDNATDDDSVARDAADPVSSVQETEETAYADGSPEEESTEETPQECETVEDTGSLALDKVAQPEAAAPPEEQQKAAPSGDLSAKIAALETAIARTQDQWEPDGEGRDAYAGTSSPAMAWQDNVDLDGTGKPIVDAPLVIPEVTVHASQDAVDDDDTQIIDEDTLRMIVADIVQQLLSESVVADAVRKELQGDLGARISQNIRKLVRREIQLALTAQGLE